MKISIEGIIGAGKSTFSALLADALGATLQNEPDEQGGQNPYLSDYYSDANRWAFTMQIHLLTKRAKQAQDAEHIARRGGSVVSDRSLPGDLAFGRLQRRLGIMTPREYDTYVAAYKLALDRAHYPDLVIRLDVPVHVALDRVASRMSERAGRRCESTIGVDYMLGLDAEITGVLEAIEAQGVPVVLVPWGRDQDHAARQFAARMLAASIRKNFNYPEKIYEVWHYEK